MIEKIILKKSSVLDKMPTAEQLDYGEIALNYNAEHPFISFKDSDGDVMPLNDYSQDIAYLYSHKLDAGVLDTINENSDAIKKKLNITDFNTFKADNTKTINAFATEVAKALETKVDKTDIEQTTGQSTTSVMSQKAVSDALSTKVGKTDIVQSTGTSETAVMSQKAVSDALSTKVDKSDIVQSTGTSETAVMSQKAVSDALSTKVGKSDIVQSTGTSTTSVMSQKASTDSFIANTPSGDPMHNLYVEVGAKWNAKTGFWELNGLTDITNEQMLTIYVETNNFLMNQSDLQACYCFSNCRTNIPNIPYLSSLRRLRKNWTDFFRQSPKIEVIVFKSFYSYKFKPDTLSGVFLGCINLRLIDGILDVSGCQKIASNDFFNCGKLESVKLYQLNYSIGLTSCKMLSSESVQYMIENATDATITITLHPEAYERAIADTGVQAALANKTNVSLAKAE